MLKCRQCGLLRRARVPPSGDVVRWYRDNYWECYRDEQLGSARENIFEHVMRTLTQHHPSAGTLVDMGCGGGALLACAQRHRWKGVGIDVSPEAVAAARARGLEAWAHDCLRCPLPDESADAVTMVNVLDHLPDPFGALEEARRLLKPSGQLYIRVPNGPLHRVLSSVPWLGTLAVLHLFGFGRRAFRYHLPRLGFRVRTIRTAPPSRGLAYGAPAPQSASRWNLAKAVYAAVSAGASAIGLDAWPWGFSIEVIAEKTGGDHRVTP